MISLQKLTAHPLKWAPYIAIIYTVGVVGLSWELTRPVFMFLVPVNILSATLLLLLFHRQHHSRFYAIIAGIGIAGFFLEYAGVQTGKIFGAYYYATGLGYKILDIPVILAINWIFIVYATASLSRKYFQHPVLRVLCATLMMVIYDIVLEPSAIRFHFWVWEAGSVPLLNYFSWGLAGIIFQTVFLFSNTQGRNLVAEILLYAQFCFFLLLAIIHWGR